MDGVLALMGFPAFLLQVKSHNESSGPCLIPFLLIKMINKSRESHGGMPPTSVQAGMGSLGNLHLEIRGLDAAVVPAERWNTGVLEKITAGRVSLGTLITGLGHLEHFGLCSTEMGQMHTEKEIHAKALMQSRQEETGTSQ